MYSERSAARASRCARQSKYKFRSGRFIAFATIVFGMSLALADAAPATKVFNIEAQPASSSLTLYARQAKVQLGFAANAVEGILTNPVKGEYYSAQALELLLKGTGLEAWYGESGIVVRRISKRARASGMVEPDPVLAKPNSLRLTPATSPMLAQAEASAPSIDDSDDRDERYKEAVKKREEIIVTGSRIRGAQGASPVVTISREDIDRAGFATVEELVDKLPQNFGAGASLDGYTDSSFSTRHVVGGVVDNRAGGASINLRGLGASSTLVLVNGHRISPGGLTARFTNISSIPVTAIERVEVLTDGASAIYGSDAIGGVVNFILRDNYEGAETRLRYGTAEGGDMPSVLFGQSVGKSWGDGNILLTYEYYHSDSLANSDRDRTSTNDLRRFGGTDWRTRGGNPANIVAGGQVFAIPAGQDGTALTAADFDPNAPLNVFNSRALHDLIPEQERNSAFIHVTEKIGKTELFAEARYSTQEYVIRDSYSGALDITVTDANPFFVDPTGTGLTTVRVDNYSFDGAISTPDLGKTDSIGAVLGARRDITETWEIEFVSTWSTEEATAVNTGRFNQTAVDAAANQTDADLAFNPFGAGLSNTNPTVLETFIDKTYDVNSQSENELWGVSFGVDGSLLTLPGGAMQVAAGIEFRNESLLSVDTGLGSKSNNSRDVLAAYTELFFPMIGGESSRAGLRRLEFSLAGRFEDYSDFGSSTNPKIGVVWEPAKNLTFRATYGTAFRAPALYDLDDMSPNANSINYLPENIADLVSIPFPIITRFGFNSGLKPEKAVTWTAGIQWRPAHLDGLSLDLTYFDIDFKDRIDFSGMNSLTGTTDPRYAPFLTLNPTLEQIAALVNDPRWEDTFGDFKSDLLSGAAPVGGILDGRKTNLAQSVVTGLDLQLFYDFPTALGSFALGLNGSYLFDFKRRLLAADPLVDEVDRLGRPIDFKARGNVTWTRDEWSISGFVNYADAYTDNFRLTVGPLETSNPGAASNRSPVLRTVNSWTTVDMTLAYNTGEVEGYLSGTRILLTAQNLFGTEPPFVDSVGGLGYDSANANALGRVLALSITKEW